MANIKGAVVVNKERCKGCELCVVACPGAKFWHYSRPKLMTKVIIMLLCRIPTLVSGVQVVVLYAPMGVSLFIK